MNDKRIIELLKNKACLKQEIFSSSKDVIRDFKDVLIELIEKLKADFGDEDSRINIKAEEKGAYASNVTIGSDTLVFFMHTNVFKLPDNHSAWKMSYLKENPDNGYCSIIHIYNFLADSFKYNRENDLGYLVARVFVNKERHFFVEGPGRMGIDYRDFMHNTLDKKNIEEILVKSMEYAIDFDLYSPPYKHVQTASVFELKEVNNIMKMKTGKRLGFKFQNEQDEII
jgi:hemerythrin